MMVQNYEDGTIAFIAESGRVLATVWDGGVSIPTTTGIAELHEIIEKLSAANMQFAAQVTELSQKLNP